MPKMRWRPGLRPGPRWGSSPRPRSRLGRGYPLPIPYPTRRQRRLDLWLPQCKILATCLCPPHFLMAGDAPALNDLERRNVPYFAVFRRTP